MAVPRGNLFFQRDLLESDARWQIRESIRTLEDISRYCKPNHAIDLSRGTGDVSFCVLISAGCSHIAAVEASAARRKIQVTVYHLKDGFDQKWSVTYDGPDQEFQGTSRSSFYDTTRMHGGITEDGQSVLLIYQPSGGGRAGAYVVNANGFTWRSPPSDTGSSYIASPGELSADSECLFYTRSGAAFGRNGEAKVVEAYSIRHLARLQATSFGFGVGVHMRNTRLLPQPRIKGPIYLAIETSSFSRDDDEQLQYSPPVLVSSDKKLQWNFAGIDSISSRGATSTFVSPDDSHLFYVEPDAAMLHHWDLKKPTLRPLGAVRLPGVEYSEARPWTVYGKIQNIKDAIPQQLHQVRFSTGCKTVTIVTVNDISVVVNVLLTFNLQLIYHQIVTIPRQTWSTYIPARIGFDETAGLNVFAMCPSRIRTTQNQLPEVLGLTGLLISLPDVFQKIKAVEEYFDLSGARLSTLMSEVENREARPELRFSWRPGVMDRNDPDAIHLEQGQLARTSPVDARRQEQFYNRVFADSQSSVWMHSTPELRRFFVPHLFSFTYPWAPESRVSVFGVVMKNEYHIVSIGPSPSNPSSDTEVLRALYTTDIRVSEEEMDHIEIYQNGTNYFLHVCKLGDQYGSYSGAPMPISRWTLLSPHFLEEDAWYDTFVIHRAGHVTMPHNWTKTPNPALYATANYYAYFVPKTFTHLEVVDYGHRSRSAYVLPKHLLWREYGLRGLRKSNPNDIFFGGGRFADSLGRYLRSIYDDKTYDESNPLFPTSFAMACNIGHRAQKTDRIDAFFRRLHDDSILLLNNSSALSCTLPLACKTRPIAALSLMRFISLYKHRINNIGSVEVKAGATSPKVLREINGKWSRWQFWFQQQIYYPVIGLIIQPLFNTQTNHGEPNTSHVTLPLPGFCSFHHKLYRAPPMLQGLMGLLGADDPIWEFIRATSPDSKELFFNRDTYLFALTRSSGQSAASPFTRLVEEILDMQDREIQLSFLKVVWLEKLLAWKMKTFGLYIYLTRTALPMLLLFSAHLAVGVCLTQDVARDAVHITPLLVFLACIEALGTCFILSVKVRQLHRIPRLFFRSIFNYIDGAAICLGLVTFFLVVSRNSPSRPFLGFSTLVIWIATVLTLRVYRPVGILLLLLTETIIGVFSFLVLLFFIILGFAFVPFLLLRNIDSVQPASNPFSSFPLTLSHMLNFISSDYGALEPFQESSAAVRTVRALYIIVITILCLNVLIALLNLKIKRADKNAENLYHLQMASLQVEIELGMLSSTERARHDWFPVWFHYSMTETEKRQWEDYVEKNPLKWRKENSFGEDKDHVPEPPPQPPVQPAATTPAPPASEPVSSPPTEQPKKATNSVTTLHTKQTDAEPEPPAPTAAATTESSTATTAHQDSIKGLPKKPSAATPSSSSSSSSSTVNASGLPSLSTSTFSTTTPPQSQIATSQQSPSPDKDSACKICGKQGKRCTGCGLVAYCGKEHQKVDWKDHKRVCKGKGRAQD